MRVILQKEVDKLGAPGDIVQVADGFARNYLIPRGLASQATKGAVRHAERIRAGDQARRHRALEEARATSSRLGKAPVRIAWQAGEEGRLFGSITAQDVADAIEQQLGEKVDRRHLRLEEPIRSLGAHEVRVHLHPEVDATITVDVVSK
jgi:large subunit ribosomal protein L9